MFKYNKFLQFPINIKNKNPRLANIVATQYGGPNGEIGASLRYLSQRYTMPDDVTKGLLTDIGVEELGHLEMVGTLVKQLSEGEPADEWTKMGSWEYYADIFVIIETNRRNPVISRVFGLASFHIFLIREEKCSFKVKNLIKRGVIIRFTRCETKLNIRI